MGWLAPVRYPPAMLHLRLGPALGLATLAACAHPGASTPASSPPASSPLTQPESALLAGQAVGLAYSGYRRGQRPDRGAGASEPTDEQVLEDLQIIVGAKVGLIRLYDAGAVSKRVLGLIRTHALPLKVMQGAWLNAEVSNHEGCPWLTEPIPPDALAANTRANEAEVARVIELATAYPEVVVAVNVGNEALVSWNDHMVSMQAILRYLRLVKDAVPQPVSTADNYVVWAEQGPALAEVVDFAAVHTYPAWEGKDIDDALDFTLENLRAVRAAVPSLPLVIGEAGWPSVASEFGARASAAKQARYVEALVAWARAHRVTTLVFEAFDEDWKGDPGDPEGAEKHWGLFDLDRRPKPAAAALRPST